MKYERINVTPEMAKNYLSTMGTNRRVNKTRVETYARDMENGTFKDCIAPICFYKDGTLFDGQHRLEAIIKSGVSVPLWVCSDIESGAIVDNGLPRSLGDEMLIRGRIPAELTKKQYTALMKQYLSVKIGSRSKNLTVTESENFLNNYSVDLSTAIRISKNGGIRVGTAKHHPLCELSAVQAALFAALIAGVDVTSLSNFCEIANTGVPKDITTKTDNSAVILGNFLLDPTTKINGANDMGFMMSVTEQAIRDFVARTPRKNSYKSIKHVYIDTNPEPDFSDHNSEIEYKAEGM